MVGFEIETSSIHKDDMIINADGSCSIGSVDNKKKVDVHPQSIVLDKENSIHMTYEVVWEPSDIAWASRWDSYLKMNDVQIHWFSIINSLVVVFFLAGILSMIIIRSLRRDIAKYNREDEPVLDENL